MQQVGAEFFAVAKCPAAVQGVFELAHIACQGEVLQVLQKFGLHGGWGLAAVGGDFAEQRFG